MSPNRIAVAVLAAVASVGVAFACGPFFPWQLFDDRDATVAEPVGLGFAFEASRLVSAPHDGLQVVEETPYDYDNQDRQDAIALEYAEADSDAWNALVTDAAGLAAAPSPKDWREGRLRKARTAINGDAALAAGAGLPIAVLDYIAGAIEFRAKRFDEALKHFEAIDRLAPEQRKIRAVAAAYMQGRVHQRTGATAKARAAFQAARAQAQAGAPDPMGLAVASLGEEARVDLVAAEVIEDPWADPSSNRVLQGGTGDEAAKAVELAGQAVRLYAEQAARGSQLGLQSLRDVAELLVANADVLERVVAQPLVRQLVVGYVVARDPTPFDDGGPQAAPAQQVVDAILAQPVPGSGDDVDRLAALAYQAGRYDAAEKLVAATTRPLGLWVRAKLALRRGDRDAAARDWISALAAIEAGGTAGSLDQPAALRLRGEAAIVKVSQGAYKESLALLFPVAGSYWGDVAYIAERVLTVDELKAVVDGMPAVDPAPKSGTDESTDSFVSRPIESLRALLARRLARAGRLAEAIPYYSTAPTAPTADGDKQGPPTADDARRYLAAQEAAAAASGTWPWQRVAHAEELFTMARLSRDSGMELVGTEGPPDMEALDGNFSWGMGQPDIPRAEPRDKKDRKSLLLGPDEADRFAASAPKPDVRFHYRLIAADQAIAAADLLPQRSQAYAATLCWAASFAIDGGDEAKKKGIYRRYISTGAYQPWAKNFGRDCPQPDFAAARTFWLKRIVTWPVDLARSAWHVVRQVTRMI
jgi:tetratricopeptide (TPR) repeat protein